MNDNDNNNIIVIFSTKHHTSACFFLAGRSYEETALNGQPECQTEARLKAWEDGQFHTIKGVKEFLREEQQE